MKKLFLLLALINIFFQFIPTAHAVQNTLNLGDQCRDVDSKPILTSRGDLIDCATGGTCLPNPNPGIGGPLWTCQRGDPVNQVIGRLVPPQPILNLGFGNVGIGQVLTNILQIIYIFAGIIFVFMVVISALQWITSGGDKEAVGKARSRLTYAIIGIVLLALAFVIVNLLGQITGFKFFTS